MYVSIDLGQLISSLNSSRNYDLRNAQKGGRTPNAER